MTFGLAAVVTFLAMSAAARADDEEKIPLDKVPKAVLDAVKAKYPDGELLGAEKENENGKVLYEIKVKNKDQKLEASFTEDGKLDSVEEEIEIKALPKEVSDALDAKYPKAKLEGAEKETAGDKITYEVRLTTAEGKKLEVDLDPKGKILEEEDKSKEKK
jgi:uncharacterized membrane protein YkoI